MMRILVVSHHGTLVGGIETYLAAVMPALAKAGHEVGFVCEEGASSLFSNCVERRNIGAWRPDVVYLHAMHDLDFQAELIGKYPAVAFAHGYYGLCISGSKTWGRPTAQPCRKDFDWKCLGYFHARQCGGSNPFTMWKDFLRQRRQLELLRTCAGVIVHAGPMRAEYLRQGIAEGRLFSAPHFVDCPISAQSAPTGEEIALVFVGRFDRLKGGEVLLEALPLVEQQLGRPARLHMIGTGGAMEDWKARAEKLRVEMHGWLERDVKDAVVRKSHLLIVPSVWPEPFGQVGLEAGCLGVPAVAFDVGGIRNWLREGVNGHLAPGDPPTARGLAEAIVKSLGNSEHYAKLRAGALEVAGEFTVERHIDALNRIFESVLKRR